MKAKKAVILFLTLCLAVGAFLCLGVSAEDAEGAAAGKLSTGALVSLIIGGVLIVVAVVLCIVRREKLKETLKSYKSEMKKITWYPRKQVVASTVFVVVSVLVIALVIGMLDYAFFQGQYLLTGKGFTFFGGNG